MDASYYTIKGPGSSKYTEKMSRFLSFAIPVADSDEAREAVRTLQNKYHDARHVCWAYMIGPERLEWQLNDNGEPSGTAGKPILGQINSFGITDVLVAVVRYFGGIKLGTSGLIAAYREAARLAIEEAGIKEVHRMARLSFMFGYEIADPVMKIIKNPEISIIDKSFDNLCSATVECRLDKAQEIKSRLSSIRGLTLSEQE